MGHWDFQAVELCAGETPALVLAHLPESHGFHENDKFLFADGRWLHLGWDDANVVAYQALVTFCQRTQRRWITSYASDVRAWLDAGYFGVSAPERDQRLAAVFGSPTTAARAGERTPWHEKEEP